MNKPNRHTTASIEARLRGRVHAHCVHLGGSVKSRQIEAMVRAMAEELADLMELVLLD